MNQLCCEFKQGNKVLAKVIRLDDYCFRLMVRVDGLAKWTAADYSLQGNAILNAHDFVYKTLKKSQNKNYTMVHYEYISQYRESYYYKYKEVAGVYSFVGRKAGKTKII